MIKKSFVCEDLKLSRTQLYDFINKGQLKSIDRKHICSDSYKEFKENYNSRIRYNQLLEHFTTQQIKRLIACGLLKRIANNQYTRKSFEYCIKHKAIIFNRFNKLVNIDPEKLAPPKVKLRDIIITCREIALKLGVSESTVYNIQYPFERTKSGKILRKSFEYWYNNVRIKN